MLNPGDLIANKLRIIRRLGAGGMGVVYEAEQVRLGRRVAVKVIHQNDAKSEEARTRFMREAQAQAQLPLEHIVQVLDVDCLSDGTLFTVMEFLDGRDLKRELQKRGSLPIAEAASYVMQACHGAGAAHAAGIVHRDLKPQNIFVTNLDGLRKVKLLDFGIAKFLTGTGQDLTATSVVVGTPTHLAPEQIAGAGDVDGRADIWALGIVLFELLTGHTPFRRPTAFATLTAVANDPPPALAEMRPDVPPGLVEVVERCLAKSPRARFQTAGELAQALAPYATFNGTVSPSLRVERGSSMPSPPNSAEVLTLPEIVGSPTATAVPQHKADSLGVVGSTVKYGQVSVSGVPGPSLHFEVVAGPERSKPTKRSNVFVPRRTHLWVGGLALVVTLGLAFALGREPSNDSAPPALRSAPPAKAVLASQTPSSLPEIPLPVAKAESAGLAAPKAPAAPESKLKATPKRTPPTERASPAPAAEAPKVTAKELPGDSVPLHL